MKKIVLLLVLALGLSFVTLAQLKTAQLITGIKFANKLTASSGPMRDFTDTIWPSPIMSATNTCWEAPTLFGDQGGGCVTGNNAEGVLAIGTRVNHTGSGNVTSVMAYLYKTKVGPGTGTCSAKIYSCGTDNLPNTSLGTSTSITMSTLADTTATFCSFTFSPAVAINGNFFVIMNLPTVVGDSLGIVSTTQTCTPAPDSLTIQENMDGSFVYLKDFWVDQSGVGLNPSMFIAPIVNEIVGINNNNAIENINVYSANNKIVVKNNSNTTIKQVAVYNLIGQEIANYPVNKNGTFTIDANLPSASYIVRIITDSKVGTYKLYINR